MTAALQLHRHPFFYTLAKLKAKREVKQQVPSYDLRKEAMDACDNATIDLAAAQVEHKEAFTAALSATVGSGPLTALGDGSIIKAIVAFFESPTGQAIIATLVKLLLAAIGL